jgi:hypothetical protein
MHSWTDPLKKALLIAVAALAVLAPSAGAATVVNGDFETGNLDGWQVYSSTDAGTWFADSGTQTPYDTTFERPFFPPAQGTFAAVSDEFEVSNPILSQDIALEPLWSHQLSFTLYYKSYGPIAVPDPNTLAVDGSAPDNQQLRVDVMKPGTPIESLNPADILTTVFANKNGDPMEMGPTTFTADLTPFAGQTVRLRIANAVQQAVFNTGVDSVSITSTPPSNVIARGKLALNKKNGTGRLAITVPGPGILIAVGKGGKNKKVKRAKLVPTGPGTVQLALRPTAKGLKVLNTKGKLKTRLDVFFTPTGGTASLQTYKVTLKKNLPK